VKLEFSREISSLPISRSDSQVRQSKGCVVGTIATQYGFVRVFADSDHYMLEMIWLGRCWWVGKATRRLASVTTLKGQATRFAKRVVVAGLDDRLESEKILQD